MQQAFIFCRPESFLIISGTTVVWEVSKPTIFVCKSCNGQNARQKDWMHNWSEELFHFPCCRWGSTMAWRCCWTLRLSTTGTRYRHGVHLSVMLPISRLIKFISKCTRQEIFVHFKCLSLRPYEWWNVQHIQPSVYILHVKCGNTYTTDSYKYLLSVYTYKKCHD